MRHAGASKFNSGSLTDAARTRKSRRNRGQRIQSRKDKAAHAAIRKEQPWL